MSATNFGPWLSTLQLSKPEQQAIAKYLAEIGFSFSDLVSSQVDICESWFNQDKIPECSKIACFRLQNAIVNLTEIPPEAAMEVEEECPEIPETKAAPPAPRQSVEQPISSPPASRPATPPGPRSYKDWDVEMVVRWIQSNDQMKKIKPDTNQKIIEFVRDKQIDGSMLDETLFKNHKDDLKLISLGGRHKFRKAIRNLVEGMFDTTQAVLAPSPDPPLGSPSVRSASARGSSYTPNDSSVQDRGFTASVQSSPQPSVSLTPQSFPPQHMDDHKAVEPIVPFGSESSVAAMPAAAFSQQPHGIAIASPASPYSVSPMPPMQQPSVQQPPSAMSQPHYQSIPAPQVLCRRWLWFSDDGFLHPYDREANAEIEEAFNRQEEEIKLTRGAFFGRFPGRYSVIFDHKEKVHRQRNNQSKEQREVIGSDHEMVKAFRIQETHVPATTYSATVAPGPMPYQYQQQNYGFGQ